MEKQNFKLAEANGSPEPTASLYPQIATVREQMYSYLYTGRYEQLRAAARVATEEVFGLDSDEDLRIFVSGGVRVLGSDSRPVGEAVSFFDAYYLMVDNNRVRMYARQPDETGDIPHAVLTSQQIMYTRVDKVSRAPDSSGLKDLLAGDREVSHPLGTQKLKLAIPLGAYAVHSQTFGTQRVFEFSATHIRRSPRGLELFDADTSLALTFGQAAAASPETGSRQVA